MKSRHLKDKADHVEALSDAVAELDQQLEQTLESEQHEMIDHLDDYFDSVETRLASLRAFCRSLRNASKNGKSTP
ncbi:MAG: hypothetical protein RIC38_04325 [Chromatocurvus sp.]